LASKKNTAALAVATVQKETTSLNPKENDQKKPSAAELRGNRRSSCGGSAAMILCMAMLEMTYNWRRVRVAIYFRWCGDGVDTVSYETVETGILLNLT